MKQVKALLFDVFGTVVDWRTSVEAELKALGAKHGIDADWPKFAQEWRTSYMNDTRKIAGGGKGPSNVDVMHRENLDKMLSSPEWSSVGQHWSKEERDELNLVWHRLKGWPDSTEALYAFKKDYIVAALSNGNMRLLVDMAKYADLPWDVVFSGELFGTYKPNPNAYLGSIHHLGLKPEEVAMVTAHLFDLRGAAAVGMPVIYIPRPNLEEDDPHPENIKSKAEGGEADLIVSSFTELVEVLSKK
ncbi:HAD-like domain-containing protein [Coprinopsis sp. MPI-PUGE-AT-0042]|nr:HAD-like domain-containing protein [Coprinopsis sp. MPI-PUGE-AT-0042]